MANVIEDIVLPTLEAEAKKAVDQYSDDAAKAIIAELVKLCPVDAIDKIIAGFEPALEQILKVNLTKLADQISKKV